MRQPLRFILSLTFIFTFLSSFAKIGDPIIDPAKERVKISGTVIEKTTKQPLEYATVTITDATNPKSIAGGITNAKGNFSIEVTPGTYNIKIEFISFKAVVFNQRKLDKNIDLGTIGLVEDAAQLNEVVVRAEKSTVEIKLDKKVYNVGQDMIVKGGTVSDVLENVPSVSVDVEGNVSLRGNENVRIFIDGRPSNALNMAEALRQIPADAIDKVEVITNPSARYDAEGGAGILNIVLKKGKNLGFNGSFIVSTGIPETYGASANLNYKTEKLNFFTSTGYDYRTSEGAGKTNSTYFNTDKSISNFIDETKNTERVRKGISTKTGVEWTIAPNTFWTNSVSYRDNRGSSTDNVNYDSFDANRIFTSTRNRLNDVADSGENLEFASNFIKNFDDKGHKLTVDAILSKEKDVDSSIITDQIIGGTNAPKYDFTSNDEKQNQFQFQVDYVLPVGETGQFEAGYKGNFNNLDNNYSIITSNNSTNNFLSNTLEYKERFNALYTQYGFKVNKFSYLFGLRWEDSKVIINLLDEPDRSFNTKKYNNFFPSAFINYEISDESSISLSYSKRLSRPRGRFLNPATNYSSNINLFRGNPELNPSFTDKFDFGYLKKWEKVTFNTSLYFENTKNVFSFIRYPNGDVVEQEVDNTDDGIDNPVTTETPVILSTPINLGKEQKIGFEFTLNYTPLKIWKLNSSFNLFNSKTTGENKYIDIDGVEQTQKLDNEAFSWFTRLSSRLTLPAKVDWQLTGMYFGPRNTAQGRNLGNYVVNMAFSKDILKDKATLAFNVSDLFNSRKMISRTNLESVSSYSEFQWRRRQFNLSFTYRLNMKKTEKKMPKNGGGMEEGGDGGEFPG
ncbi:outer membrane beta-barrel family protein [Flavobacterium seoulense]|uniref:TonB-denpendent receptor n=1 Tax=Flavobacterium seoulense TaxID=1492738 RepID=A0A066WKP7_9FLAO|nr:outer membrane beta-barrel family protein [Flavobacterium seoulense]KDN54391.1 TonB-denpendent receptor [Flavobacterium seoulense]